MYREESMEKRAVKIYSKVNSNVVLRVIKGHFATTHSHINYFMDMTGLKSRLSEARGGQLPYWQENTRQRRLLIRSSVLMDVKWSGHIWPMS